MLVQRYFISSLDFVHSMYYFSIVPKKKGRTMKYRTINITAKTHETLMRIKQSKAKKEGVCTSLGTIILDAVKTKYPEECGVEKGI